MRRLGPLAAAIAALLLAPAAAPARLAHTALVDGDSLAVGTKPYLPGDLPGWRLHQSADISRHTPQGVDLLAHYGRHLPRVIFLSLGTNDDPRFVSSFRHEILRAVHIAGPHRCIVWATIHRPAVGGVSYGGYNATLKKLAKGRPTLWAFDWDRMARAHPSWFGPDGVHPGVTGYRARARAIARDMRACAR